MSDRIGKMITCDRCGETIFLRWEGMSEFDGGYSKIQHFEKTPEGWGSVVGLGQLCPECHEEYDKLIKDFMEAANVKA